MTIILILGTTLLVLAIVAAVPKDIADPPHLSPLKPSIFHDNTDHTVIEVDGRLHTVLSVASAHLENLFRGRPGRPSSFLRLDYTIFHGRSALRDLRPDVANLLPLDPTTYGALPIRSVVAEALRLASAVLLLLLGLGDAAHDSVLGVTPDNLDEAEYAATHRGETSWSKDHPLTSSADLIHAAIHRLEGPYVGEGGHEGYDNAKFWLAGGPKMLERPEDHSVRGALARRAHRRAPGCVRRWGVVAPRGGATHEIIAGGGRKRTVSVPEGEWDGFAFVDLCRRLIGGDEKGLAENVDETDWLTAEEKLEAIDLQKFELIELLRVELAKAGLAKVQNDII